VKIRNGAVPSLTNIIIQMWNTRTDQIRVLPLGILLALFFRYIFGTQDIFLMFGFLSYSTVCIEVFRSELIVSQVFCQPSKPQYVELYLFILFHL